MDIDFTGKTALVTGSGGDDRARQQSKRLPRAARTSSINDVDEAKGLQVLDELQKAGAQAIFVSGRHQQAGKTTKRW